MQCSCVFVMVVIGKACGSGGRAGWGGEWTDRKIATLLQVADARYGRSARLSVVGI